MVFRFLTLFLTLLIFFNYNYENWTSFLPILSSWFSNFLFSSFPILDGTVTVLQGYLLVKVFFFLHPLENIQYNIYISLSQGFKLELDRISDAYIEVHYWNISQKLDKLVTIIQKIVYLACWHNDICALKLAYIGLVHILIPSVTKKGNNLSWKNQDFDIM